MSDKLDRLLSKHRPEAPPARAGEAQRIWNRISAGNRRPSPFGKPWLPLTGTLAALLVLWFAAQPMFSGDSFDEEAFVLTEMAEFYDAEEEELGLFEFY